MIIFIGIVSRYQANEMNILITIKNTVIFIATQLKNTLWHVTATKK